MGQELSGLRLDYVSLWLQSSHYFSASSFVSSRGKEEKSHFEDIPNVSFTNCVQTHTYTPAGACSRMYLLPPSGL